jgi:hypothetical protein
MEPFPEGKINEGPVLGASRWLWPGLKRGRQRLELEQAQAGIPRGSGAISVKFSIFPDFKIGRSRRRSD